LKAPLVGVVGVCFVAALAFCDATYLQPASAALGVFPRSIDFGEQPVGSESLPQTITVSNPTRQTIALEQIITSGIDFSEKSDCPNALAPGTQCSIQVTFKPAIIGARIGNLDIMGSDPSSPHFVALNGTGK
jgi:hypothetical protein